LRRQKKTLKVRERARGTELKGKNIGGLPVLLPKDDTPTLSSLGLTKRGSSEAQILAERPCIQFAEKYPELSDGVRQFSWRYIV